MFDEFAREKFVDWFGYSASVSPYILEQFEKEAGYPFRPEYIIDQGYHNNTNRVCPPRNFAISRNSSSARWQKLMKVLVDICHENGREAMMFLGDHWIGTEPFGEYFKEVGVDAVVGSVGNGATLRLISDIPGVKYTGRFLPYFFPGCVPRGRRSDQGGQDKLGDGKTCDSEKKPVDRIGYGGYLKLALQFPDFYPVYRGYLQ